MKIMTLKMDEETNRKLEELARLTYRNKTQTIRALIEESWSKLKERGL